MSYSPFIMLAILLLAPLAAPHAADAQKQQTPTKPAAARAEFGAPGYTVPAGMVSGGAFIDRIRPMPVDHGLRSDVWGGDNVKPRNAENGIEDPKWSYWCMSVLPGSDGRVHMFACRWPEDSPKGHATWPSSQVVHALADRPTGPFVIQQEIGPGHNVMCYQAKDGTYVIYVIGRAYTAKSLDGPWSPYDLQYDLRGTAKSSMSNLTFTRREDGSYLMVSRQGHVWISEDGLKPFKKITSQSRYPPIEGRFEDPVVWRDEVQYNLIVNDWFGRTAYYLRSRDGVHWVWDQGKAYDTDVVRHPDGGKESWAKLERCNIRQDTFGRATHIYFAAIDCQKSEDKGGDNHSSKIIALPLTVQRRLEILNERPIGADTREIRLAIKAEEGFDPAAEVDVQSLIFGAPSLVDFGKGGKAVRTERSGKDLIVMFNSAGLGLKVSDYVAKLLGKTKQGEMLFGYANLPGKTEVEPILVSRAPQLSPQGDGNYAISVLIENFGQVKSAATPMKLAFKEKGETVHTMAATIPGIAPYGSAMVTSSVISEALKARNVCEIEMTINSDRPDTEHYKAVRIPLGK